MSPRGTTTLPSLEWQCMRVGGGSDRTLITKQCDVIRGGSAATGKPWRPKGVLRLRRQKAPPALRMTPYKSLIGQRHDIRAELNPRPALAVRLSCRGCESGDAGSWDARRAAW